MSRSFITFFVLCACLVVFLGAMPLMYPNTIWTTIGYWTLGGYAPLFLLLALAVLIPYLQKQRNKLQTAAPKENEFDWAHKREDALLLQLRALYEWKDRLVGRQLWSNVFEKRFAWVARQAQEYLRHLMRNPQWAHAQHKRARFQPGVSVPIEPGIWVCYDGSKRVDGELAKLIYTMEICYWWNELQHELDCDQTAAEANSTSHASTTPDSSPQPQS